MANAIYSESTVYPQKYAHGLWFVLFCYGFVTVNYTHILQGYFSGSEVIMWLPGASEATLTDIGELLTQVHEKQ